MPLPLWFDRVQETTAVTGTGAATLLGAVTGCRAFSTVGDGGACKYTIWDNAGNWEVGQGSYTSAGNLLNRTTVESSTNGNAAVNFGAGTKNVWLDITSNWLTAIQNSTLTNQNANLIFAGPSSGGAAAPTYRSLVAADMPAGLPTGFANPTASVGLSAVNGSATTAMRSDGAPALSQSIAPIWTGVHEFQPAARSATAEEYFGIVTPPDTTLTASTESIGIQLGGDTSANPLTVARQWATGALASQREIAVTAPTYGFVGASTLNSCSTLDVSGSPIAGTNCTLGTTSFTGTGGSALTLSNSYAMSVGGSGAPKLSVDGTGLVISQAGFYSWNGGSLGAPTNFFKYNSSGVDGNNNLNNWLDIYGTFPASPAASVIGAHMQFTGAGSSAQNETGLNIQIQSGYTGSGFTAAGKFLNSSSGTSVVFGYPGNNCGSINLCQGTTTGNNFGSLGHAESGVLNIGHAGFCNVAAPSKANVGAAGFATNTGAAGTQTGGYFGLVTAYPTWANAALIADNGATSSPVFLGQVNGVTKVTIDSSGNMQMQTISAGTWQGTKVGLLYGGTNADLSGTGGASNYLKQSSVGAAITVGTIPASDIASGAALTKTDDANVTLTLGGTPSTALLAAASITVNWSGTLAVSRGGTGDSSLTAYAVLCGGTTSTAAVQSIAGVGTSGQVLTSNGAGALPTFQAAGAGSIDTFARTMSVLSGVW